MSDDKPPVSEITFAHIVLTLSTLDALKAECVTKRKFEDAVIFDNTIRMIEKRNLNLPTWPANRPFA